MKYIAGIDPGFTGAIAVVGDGVPVAVWDMPVLTVGKKTELDEIGLKSIMQNFELSIVAIEKAGAMPGQGIASTARYLIGFGIIRGLCVGLGLPYQLVHPATWKARIMRDMPKEKQASVMKCNQLFPAWSAENLRLKKHHGRADALLIAHYAATA